MGVLSVTACYVQCWNELSATTHGLISCKISCIICDGRQEWTKMLVYSARTHSIKICTKYLVRVVTSRQPVAELQNLRNLRNLQIFKSSDLQIFRSSNLQNPTSNLQNLQKSSKSAENLQNSSKIFKFENSIQNLELMIMSSYAESIADTHNIRLVRFHVLCCTQNKSTKLIVQSLFVWTIINCLLSINLPHQTCNIVYIMLDANRVNKIACPMSFPLNNVWLITNLLRPTNALDLSYYMTASCGTFDGATKLIRTGNNSLPACAYHFHVPLNGING